MKQAIENLTLQQIEDRLPEAVGEQPEILHPLHAGWASDRKEIGRSKDRSQVGCAVLFLDDAGHDGEDGRRDDHRLVVELLSDEVAPALEEGGKRLPRVSELCER